MAGGWPAALGLLLCWFGGARGRSCGSQFGDVASRAYLANIVFQGTYLGKYAYDDLVPGGRYKGYFSVSAVLKGQLPRSPREDYLPVVAGDFGVPDPVSCVAGDLSSNATYIVFLQAADNPGTPIYNLAAFPALATPDNKRLISEALCEGCGESESLSIFNCLLGCDCVVTIFERCSVDRTNWSQVRHPQQQVFPGVNYTQAATAAWSRYNTINCQQNATGTP